MKRLPNDRGFVDPARKIVDSWLGVFKGLEQLLQLTPEDFTTLQAIIRASQASEAEGEDTTNIFELPINTEPLFSEDYFIGWKSNEGDARRFLMSLFVPTIISTTSLNGLALVDIAVPSGYKDVELRLDNLSHSTSAVTRISYSEDGGATLLSQKFQIFTDGFSQSTTSTQPPFTVTSSLAAGTIFGGSSLIRDYQSVLPKMISDNGLYYSASGVAWAGSRFLDTSTAAINTIELSTSTGTWDAGIATLIGIPMQ